MKFLKFLFALVIVLTFSIEAFAQSRITARGSSIFRKVGIHRGNQVRTIFTNYGVIAQPGDQGPRGAWKYDADGYVGDISPLVGIKLPIRDYNNDGIPDTVVNVIITPVDRPGGGRFGPGGVAWGFEPIPGFANPTLNKLGEGVAMSHLTETWPLSWPDHPDWTYSGLPVVVNGVDMTPKVDWNGYFGRAQFSADQESYFWMDDNADGSMFSLYGFMPDSNDQSRRGEALQVSVRGLQWANFLAQDVLFWLYNIKNDGTTNYDQAAFGVLVGTYVGAAGDEYNDDASYFEVRESITYSYDIEPGMGGRGYIRPSANPLWQPNPFAVGYISYSFLESPGNPVDGIDNDGDNFKYSSSAPYFTTQDFQPKVVKPGDKLILIDKNTYERTSFTMPNDTVTVYSMGTPFFLNPNVTTLVEGNIDALGNVNPNAHDGIDNNLNGIIDENYAQHYRQFKKSPSGVVLIDTLNPVQHLDYLGNNTNQPMIDEKRDDGIDNNSNWNVLLDDVGLDGKANTHDLGEGDGRPTSGYQPDGTGKLVDSGEPGEPNIDKTDVDESDQLGLTSFQYFVPAGSIKMSDQRNMWSRLRPGFFDVPSSIVHNVATKGEDGDFIYGSGYFPLLAGKTERFSLALAYGDDYKGVIKTKKVAQLIYNANYNFPKPPEKPTLTAVAGDKKVTLYWDRIAEASINNVTKEKDFEGYKIYRGTDPDFTDALQITNGQGQKVFYKPIAQFDLKDGITGYFSPSSLLFELSDGAPYYLGDDSGIQNSYVDNDVTNGRTYYYAVVAYNRGNAAYDIFPAENTKFISKDAAGVISTDINTAVVVPNAPVLGYVPPSNGSQLTRLEGNSNVVPYFDALDPTRVIDASYNVTFSDSIVSGVPIAFSYTVTDANTNEIVLDNEKMSPKNGTVFNGVQLSIDTSYQRLDSIKINLSKSGWNHPSAKNLKTTVSQFTYPGINGVRSSHDYAIVFSDAYQDSSNHLTGIFGGNAPPANTKLNFKIYDVTIPDSVKRVPFIFTESSSFRRDTLSFFDQISMADPTATYMTWKIVITGDSTSNIPAARDTLYLSFNKPITSKDKFTFSSTSATTDNNKANNNMDQIRAVPNPYIVTNVFEQPLPPQVRGRGERIVDFINVPSGATIRIFTSSGDLVRTLHQDGNLNNGSVKWDLRTEEGLDISYGVYFYIVTDQGNSEKKFGKLAIIK